MSRSIDAVFGKAIEQLDREDRRLASIEITDTSTTFDHDGFRAINRALSYVVMGGVLEELMRDLPSALAADLTSLAIQRRQLPVSLLSALDAEVFRKCGTDNVSSLIARTELLHSAIGHTVDARPVTDFGDFLTLADGQTINERHFRALWMLLDLDGDWRNEPNDKFLLQEIKDKRNGIAHWTEDPVQMGRSKRPTELRKMVSRLSALLEHLQLSMWYWLDSRSVDTNSGKLLN